MPHYGSFITDYKVNYRSLKRFMLLSEGVWSVVLLWIISSRCGFTLKFHEEDVCLVTVMKDDLSIGWL
jgi:hypothetical protein